MQPFNNLFDNAVYMQILDTYIETGECKKIEGGKSDPLYSYLESVMNDPLIKIQVLSDDICAKYFYDTMMSFIVSCLERERFNVQRSQSEQEGMELTLEWSERKKKDGWQALLKHIGGKYQQYGFDKRFYQGEFGQNGKYADESVWEKMVDDWKEAFEQQMKEQQEQYINERDIKKNLCSNMKSIPEYLQKNKIEKEEFFQTWGIMGGLWNTYDFERIRKIVSIQKEYPIITKIANQMGRIADEEGNEEVYVGGGFFYQLEHSSKCDIQGVTVGNNLNVLLPIELVQYADEDLEDLFTYKYLTNKLQTFQCKSEIIQPFRQLVTKSAKLKGPIIVCLDTSESMMGKPQKIANSLLIRLLEISDRQKRDCFLIAFSISVYPIDVRKERKHLLDFFSNIASGGTDSTQMLGLMFDLLQSKKEYINADVLWISDFKIPLPSSSLQYRMLEYKQAGTHFYGLQIGVIVQNEWMSFFDHIYQIGYIPSRGH